MLAAGQLFSLSDCTSTSLISLHAPAPHKHAPALFDCTADSGVGVPLLHGRLLKIVFLLSTWMGALRGIWCSDAVAALAGSIERVGIAVVTALAKLGIGGGAQPGRQQRDGR